MLLDVCFGLSSVAALITTISASAYVASCTASPPWRTHPITNKSASWWGADGSLTPCVGVPGLSTYSRLSVITPIATVIRDTEALCHQPSQKPSGVETSAVLLPDPDRVFPGVPLPNAWRGKASTEAGWPWFLNPLPAVLGLWRSNHATASTVSACGRYGAVLRLPLAR